QLRVAHDQLSSIGMDAFADRARQELAATGEKVRRQTVETRDQLTEQERQIARLASEGLSNPEIGARLFLSSRTVEWHLRKVYSKLGINSRRQLRTSFSEDRVRGIAHQLKSYCLPLYLVGLFGSDPATVFPFL